MDHLYLILHKVRGQAAVDVAQRVVIGDEDVWLIPTSGHRAWPIRYEALIPLLGNIEGSAEWAALPDHYPEPRPSLVAQLRARLHEWVVRAKRDVGRATLTT